MRLDELFQDLDVRLPKLDRPPEVRGISHDSRRVHRGDLYVAVVGESFDGREFIEEAGRRGAVAVLGPSPEGGRGQTALTELPWVVSRRPRELMGTLGARLYGAAHERLRMMGVTGTNGKSTVVTVMGSILDAADEPAAVLGTLGYRFGGEEWAGSGRTTPEATDLHRMLAEMEDRGARAVAMEVSSHALAQGRVAGLEFDVAVFTHLSRDHLDFHGDMESYFRAKMRLFRLLRPDTGRAVANVSDTWGRRLTDRLREQGIEPVTFGHGSDADVYPLAADLDVDGIRARIATPRGDLEISSSLIGRFHLENLLACVAAAEALELPHEDVSRGIETAAPVDGRLELVTREPFPAVVDYAHTPGALESALRALRDLTDRRIAVVFGCGGGRDRGKRPLMGTVAGEHADLAVVTSDNPRHEEPKAIIDEVVSGTENSKAEVWVEPSRRRAIRRAVGFAREAEDRGERWVVVVAGKGHETTQDLGKRIVPFDDREELLLALEKLAGEKLAVEEGDAGQATDEEKSDA